MELESVRALKEELLATTLSQEQRTLPAGPGASAPAQDAVYQESSASAERRALDWQPSPRPALALGIASAPAGGFALAVRVQDPKEVGGPLLEEVEKCAPGEVDIRYIGLPVPAATPWYRGLCEPLRCGASVGSRPQRTTGTLGCFVEPLSGGPLQLLSNAHVLAGWGAGHLGDPILQPGWQDRDGADRVVATLTEVADLRSGSPENDDCAIAELSDGCDAEPTHGLLAADAHLDEPVSKLGRTTGETSGRVRAIEVGPVKMDYPRPLGTLEFDNLTEVEGDQALPFAAHGDSGSIVLGAAEHTVLGLLFAITAHGGRNRQGVAYLIPFDRVLKRLGVQLVP